MMLYTILKLINTRNKSILIISLASLIKKKLHIIKKMVKLDANLCNAK